MKRKRLIIITAALLTGAAPVLPSCTEKEAPETETVGPELKPDPEIQPDPQNPSEPSAELQKKLEAIYDNASTGPQKVTTVHQLAILTSVNASLDNVGPITVTPALLNGKGITLVTLGGTQMVDGQATTMEESQLASFGKPNDYLYALTDLFTDGTIPADKPVVVTGISLGGMIAQQLLSVSEVLESHEIAAIITFGSPVTLPLDRKGVKVVRFADVNDKVPQMGELPLNSGMVQVPGLDRDGVKKQIALLHETERIMKQSKYTGMIETHALSYIEDPCWEGTDFLGDPAKANELELTAAMTFHAAPKRQK